MRINLTDFEFKFPRQVTPGSKAFAMGVLRQNNPYTNKKDRDAWDRGYNAAKRKYEADKYRQQKEAQQEAIDAGFAPKTPNKFRNVTRKPERTFTVGTSQVNKFNNKFRTAS